MDMMCSGKQAQPACTAMPAFSDCSHDRLKTAQLMELIQGAAHRPPLNTQKSRQFLIRQQRVCQQQAKDAHLARGQAQSQQSTHLLFLQTNLPEVGSAIGQASHNEMIETPGSPRGYSRDGSAQRYSCVALLFFAFFQTQ